MHAERRRDVVLILAVLAAISAVALAAESIEGRWRLVEQSYGTGRGDIPDAGSPVLIEFRRTPTGITGRVWPGDEKTTAADWPALFTADGPRPVRLREIESSPTGDRIRARYEVEPSGEEGDVLEIIEEYRLSDDGAALVGTVTVSLSHDGKAAGSYAIRRRFERQR
jgi:hypothetical protein